MPAQTIIEASADYAVDGTNYESGAIAFMWLRPADINPDRSVLADTRLHRIDRATGFVSGYNLAHMEIARMVGIKDRNGYAGRSGQTKGRVWPKLMPHRRTNRFVNPGCNTLAFWDIAAEVPADRVRYVRNTFDAGDFFITFGDTETGVDWVKAPTDDLLRAAVRAQGLVTVDQWLAGQSAPASPSAATKAVADHELHLLGAKEAGRSLVGGSVKSAERAGTQPVAVWRAAQSTSESRRQLK